jgi:hypothetical protein
MEKYTSNPYQIRTDLLAMSKEMLDKTYDTQLQLAYAAMEQYKDNAELALEAWKKYIPTMYTPEEVKKQAETLYEFVVNKK